MKRNSALGDTAAWIFDEIFGRLLRRLAWLSVGALFALIALYHLTIAGMVALSAQFGILNARLIVAAVYLVVAAVAFVMFKMMRPKNLTIAQAKSARGDEPEQAAQIASLVEALTLGYSLARKPKR